MQIEAVPTVGIRSSRGETATDARYLPSVRVDYYWLTNIAYSRVSKLGVGIV